MLHPADHHRAAPLIETAVSPTDCLVAFFPTMKVHRSLLYWPLHSFAVMALALVALAMRKAMSLMRAHCAHHWL